MKNLFILLGTFFLHLSLHAQHNVIVLIADDLGTDYFGFYEDHADTVDVPVIRELLKNGVRFKNAMSNPVCSPTRAGMLTGRYSFRTGVGYIVGSTSGSGTLDTSETTIPRILKTFNPLIAKANIGKWHLHNPTPAFNLLNPNILGYDHFEGPFIGALTSYTNWTKYTNGIASTVTNYATSENVDNAVSWLKSVNANHPFFLWLAFNAPHSPYHLPPAMLHSYSNLSGTQQHIQQNPKEYFKAMLQSLDTEIGRLLDSLQVLNRLDSTDIIFMGDNGNTMQTAQVASINHAKGTLYQYGVHVPLIISGPSVVTPGRTSEALVNTVDVFATTLELMGDTAWNSSIPVNKPVDSKSLVPILKNQNLQVRTWAFTELFRTIPDLSDGKAIRNMEYKLLKFDSGQEEFYNLFLDSAESVNLLVSTLTGADLANYTFLCNEMTNLIGSTSFCNANVANDKQIEPIKLNAVFPNPFTTKIHCSSADENTFFNLTSSSGRAVYSGKYIEEQNFESLAVGIYFLNIITNQESIYFKLIHL